MDKISHQWEISHRLRTPAVECQLGPHQVIAIEALVLISPLNPVQQTSCDKYANETTKNIWSMAAKHCIM